jgi:dihydrofolate reductase
MIISHLVARSANNIIGSNNDLPWSLKDDLLHFKSYTLHKPILMGRKTFESIGRPLPNRTSIVITSKALEPMDGVLTSDSIEGGFQLAKDIFPEEVIVIGGGEIFQATIELANKLVISEVDCVIDGDISYPVINLSDWRKELIGEYAKNNSNEFAFKIFAYERKD